MKFLHLADLHLGKTIYGTSMIENGDQAFFVDGLLKLVEEERPDAVLIAGDVYDRSSPSGDATVLLDRLLTNLNHMGVSTLIVSGNHDSGKRLSFGEKLFSSNSIYLSGISSKELKHITIKEKSSDDEVTFWLLPYVFPAQVAGILEDETIKDYNTAVRRLLEVQNIDFSKRNVLIAHQNVVAGGKEVERGGSESMVGGVGPIEYTAFDGFDYVALGHIHSSYHVGREEVRYAGSPLCYHFDEIRQPKKGAIMVELGGKGCKPLITTKTIEPLHEMVELKNTYANLIDILDSEALENKYIKIVVTDMKITPEISEYFHGRIEEKRSTLMELRTAFEDTLAVSAESYAKQVEGKSLEALFSELYLDRKGTNPSKDEQQCLKFAEELLINAESANESLDEQIDKLYKFLTQSEKSNDGQDGSNNGTPAKKSIQREGFILEDN